MKEIMEKLEKIERKIDSTNDKLEDHITQDEKIIMKLEPLIQDYEYGKEWSKRMHSRLNVAGKLTGLLLGLGSLVAGIVKIFA